MGSLAEKTRDKVVPGGPSKVADCGAGQVRLQLAARQQLVDPARWRLVEQMVPHLLTDKPGGTIGEQNRPHNPELQRGEIKPQTSD